MLKRKSKIFRIICGLLVFLLFESSLERVQAQDTPFLPHLQSNILELSVPYSLPVLRGMRVYPDKPFELDFVVDSGNHHTLEQKETSLLVKYFLTCLTIPEEDLWVNLSPYESGRIIPDELALTDAGNTLLKQDKLLKQLASSLTYPETRLGKKFWAQVYKKTYEKFGTTQLPVNTYNKVWIVPDRAIVYDMGNSALIGQTHLKVMLEEDYLALKKHSSPPLVGGVRGGGYETHKITAIITREIILPELEKEINEGKNFAPVRQIFYSMVLAAWFKRMLKRNVLSHCYVNKKKISGIDGVDKKAKEQIYKQYLHMYKVGAYNYIREDTDPISQQMVPRKYFSGGLFFGDLDRAMKTLRVPDANAIKGDFAQMTAGSSLGVARVELLPIGRNGMNASGSEPISELSLKNFAMTVALAVDNPFTADKGLVKESAKSRVKNSAQMALPSFLREWALTVALAVTLISSLGGLAQPRLLAQDQTRAVTASLVQEAPTPAFKAPPAQALAASNHILRFGGEITPADRQDIQKIRKIVHLEDVIALNGHKNPASKGGIYDVDINWVARNWDRSFKQNHVGRVLEAIIVAAQHKLGLHVEDGRLGPETRQAIAQVVKAVGSDGGLPSGSPPPEDLAKLPSMSAVVPLSTVAQALPVSPAPLTQQADIPSQKGAAINSPAPKAPQAIYTHDYLMRPTPLESQIVSRVGGVVSDLVSGKNVSVNGPLVNVKDRHNTFDIERLTSDIQIQQDLVSTLEKGQSQGASNSLDLVEAKLELLKLRKQLDDARTQEELRQLKAPYNSTVYDVNVAEGDSIKPGAVILSYRTRDRLRFDIPIPDNVQYFENMAVTLQDIHRTEIPVNKSTFWFNYDLSSKLQTRYLSIIVTPQAPISEEQLGQQLKLHVQFLGPTNNFTLPHFAGHATTHTFVGKINEYTKTAPAATSYRLKVNQGDWVKQGQSIAQGDPRPLETQLDIKLIRIEAINIKLSHPFLADGTPINAKTLANLAISRNQLIADARELRDQMARLDVKADADGVIVWSGENGSNVFQEGDGLYRVLKDRVFLGSFEDDQLSIILPKAHVGDFVEVGTYHGRLLGEVTAVLPSPHSPSIALEGLNFVKVTVYDPMHILHPGPMVPEDRVRVTLLTEQEKKQAQALLSASHLNSPSTVLVGSPPPPPPDLLEGYATSLFMSNRTSQANMPAAPPAYYPPQGPVLSFTQIDPMVDQNQYLFINEFHQYWQSKIAEGFPRAKKFSITGSLFGNGNGKFSGMVGADALINGVAAGVTPYGRLANIGSVVFGQFFGDFIHLVSGGIAKEEALARAGTNSLNYTLQTAHVQQIENAHDALIELYGAQQKIRIQDALLRDLNEAQKKAGIATSLGVIAQDDTLPIKLQGQVHKADGDAVEFKRQESFWSNTLNLLTGQNTAAGQTMAADVPFTEGTFSSVSDPQGLIAQATGPNSKDPRLLKARADVEIQIKSLTVNHVKNLPTLGVGAIMTPPDVNISSLPYEPLGGSTDRVSTSTPGFNPVMRFSWPVINQQGKLEKEIIASQFEAAKAKVEKTRMDMGTQAKQAIDNINYYAREIASAQQEYQDAVRVWQIFAGNDPEVFVQYQYYPERQKIADLSIKLVGLKTKYLREVEVLKKMGVRIETSKQGPAPQTDKAMLSNETRRGFLRNIGKFAVGTALAVGGLQAQDSRVETPQRGYSSHAVPTVNPQAFIGAGLNDTNPLNRMEVLEMLKYYPNTKDSVDALIRTIMFSPAPDVREQIVRFMVQERQDLRFFIQLIVKASKAGNGEALDLGYQSVEDILTNNPKILQIRTEDNFSPDSTYSDVSPQAAKTVFLTLLAANPDSIGLAPLLQGKYWTEGDLAGIYNEFNVYYTNHPDVQQAAVIRDLARTWIMSKLAVKNLPNTLNKALFEKPPKGAWHQDINTKVAFEKLTVANMTFLNTSPQLGRMQQYLDHDLYVLAEGMTRNYIRDNPSPQNNGRPVLDLTYLARRPGSSGSLSYFQSLGSDQQEDYVGKSQNAELVRILQLSNLDESLRTIVLSRLMSDPSGRLLVRKVYLNSSDERLCATIRDNPSWQDNVYTDAQTIDNPTTNRIFRAGNRKMYKETGKEALLNALLEPPIYSALELSSLDDPRDDPRRGNYPIRTAQVHKVAVEWALEAVRQWPEYSQQLPSKTNHITEPEINLDELTQKSQSQHDPREFEGTFQTYLRNHADTQNKRLLENFTALIHQFDIEHINNLNRDLPSFPSIVKYVFWIAGLFGVYGGIKAILALYRNSIYLPTADLRTLVKDLNEGTLRDTTTDNGNNGSNHAMLAAQALAEEPKTKEIDPFKEWEKRIHIWSQPETPIPFKKLSSDLNFILNHIFEQISSMRYSPELIRDTEDQKFYQEAPYNKFYQVSYKRFLRVANETVLYLTQRLANEPLLKSRDPQAEIMRASLMEDKNTIIKSMRYAKLFLLVLKCRGTIDKFMTYKFPKKDWGRELLYGIARKIFFYDPVRWGLQLILKLGIPRLLHLGNEILPGLYKDPKAIFQESQKRLKQVIAGGIPIYSAQLPEDAKDHKLRDFRSMMFSLLAPLQLALSSYLYLSGRSEFDFVSGLMSLFSVFYTVFNFWIPNLKSLNFLWGRNVDRVIDKADRQLDKLIDPYGTYKNGRSREQKNVDLVKAEGRKAIEAQLNPHTRSVDAVVIVCENRGDIEAVEEHLQAIQAQLIGRGVDVYVLPSRGKGSGYAYLDALRMIKKAYKRRVFEFIGNDVIPDPNLWDFRLIDGIRAAQSMAENGKTGDVLVFAKAPSFGPMHDAPDAHITVMTSKVTSSDLPFVGAVNTDYFLTGDSTVNKILEKGDEKAIRAFLKERKVSLEDLFAMHSASNGIYTLGSDAVEIFSKISDALETSVNKPQLMHWAGDLLIPVLILLREQVSDERKKRVKKYIVERSEWPDLNPGDSPLNHNGGASIQDVLNQFYGSVEAAVNAVNPKLAVKADEPYASSFQPNTTRERWQNGDAQVQETLAYVKEVVSAVNKAQVSSGKRSTGGIDLNFQPQFIPGASNAGSVSIQEAALPNMPDGFKGFNFNIVCFTSNLTVNGAFELMFNLN